MTGARLISDVVEETLAAIRQDVRRDSTEILAAVRRLERKVDDLMTLTNSTDQALTDFETKAAADLAAIKTTLTTLQQQAQAAADGDGMTSEQAATHVTTLNGLLTQLDALATPPAPPATPADPSAPAGGTVEP